MIRIKRNMLLLKELPTWTRRFVKTVPGLLQYCNTHILKAAKRDAPAGGDHDVGSNSQLVGDRNVRIHLHF